MEVNFLRNIAVNLRAKGPAAVLCTLTIRITVLGLFGTTDSARFAMAFLCGVFLVIGLTLAQRT